MNRYAGKVRIGVVATLAATAFAIMAVAASNASRASAAAKHPEAIAAPRAIAPSAAAKLHIADLYGKLPLIFERNDGQTDPRAKFISRGEGYTLFLTPTEAVLALRRPGKGPGANFSLSPRAGAKDPGSEIPRAGRAPNDRERDDESGKVETSILRVKMVGASPSAEIQGVDQLAGKSNYFVGNDSKKWRAKVPTYSKVRYRNVYPGIDLVYYGASQRQLEYDFILAPGANPKAIGLRFEGAEKLALNSKGDLVVKLAGGGEVLHHAPEIYQERGGKREQVDGKCVLRGKNTIGFELAAYDSSRAVYIDPGLTYSIFLGGDLPVWGSGIALDSSGNAYVTGLAESTDFPTTLGAFQTTSHACCGGAFVTKLAADGSGVVYSTYLSGSFFDLAFGVAVDSSGFAYVTGYTYSDDFPTTPGAFHATSSRGYFSWGDYFVTNGFVTKLNADGSGLVYSTYLSGSTGNVATGIAVDYKGNAYVTGIAFSDDFPTTPGAFQTSKHAPAYPGANAYAMKLNTDGSGLVYSTYLGGRGGLGFVNNQNFGNPFYNCGCFGEVGIGIAVDSVGNAYVSGWTSSFDFPTTLGAFQTVNHAAASGGNNGFVTKLTADGTGLVYSTYLGGSLGGSGGIYVQGDAAFRIAVDSSGSAFVTGQASSSDFPTTPGAFQTANDAAANGGDNAFVTKLTPDGTALVYSTYLGGSGGSSFGEFSVGIAINSFGDAYVTGYTVSTDFPTTPDALQTINNGGGNPNAFVTELNSDGTALLYSTYLGFGSASVGDWGFGIATDLTGNAYVTGWTIFSGSSLATVGEFRNAATATSSQDAFAAKLDLPQTQTPTPTTSVSVPATLFTGSSPAGNTVPKNLTVRNTGKKPLFIGSVLSSYPAEFAVTGSTCPPGGLAPGLTCTIALGFTPKTLGARSATLSVSDNAKTSPQHVALSGTGTADMITTASVSISTVKWGTTVTSAVTIYNRQTVAVSLSESFSGANAGDFNLASGGTCTATLAALSACTQRFTFTPRVLWKGASPTESATMVVSDSPDVTRPHKIPVTVAATIPDTVLPATVLYGPVYVAPSKPAKTKSITVINLSTFALTISIGSIGGANAADFTLTSGTCSGTLSGNSSCTYAVRFKPSAAIAESANVAVSVSNDPTSPHNVSLTGTGL